MSSLVELVRPEVGSSSWIAVSQERIDAFAAATDDLQWIHTDSERAADGPFGTTAAHGFLTLSLCVPMLHEVLPPRGALTVNYGVDRVASPPPCRPADMSGVASVSPRSKIGLPASAPRSRRRSSARASRSRSASPGSSS